MLKEQFWKLVTLDFLRGGGDGGGERAVDVKDEKPNDAIDMGDSCSKVPPPAAEEGEEKEQLNEGGSGGNGKHQQDDAKQVPLSPTIARLPPLASTVAGSKRSRDGGKFSGLRRSIFRVGSRIDRGAGSGFSTGDVNGVPHSPRARASTYSHVHDAVMYNLSEAEMSKHDQTVPMGVIGLKNLGNTCFLNSSLQCLSATIPLTDYFLGYDYRSEINKDNFLGTGGKLVVAYAELMKEMWLGSKSVVEPVSFKKQLGTFSPQFSGYHQHDAQEMIAFLLDGIHEDLNRVKDRPYVEDKDCDGTRDEEDAIENWKNYLRRNKSLIVDMFQGQIRNTCKCLKCGHINIRFEPFMYLSLPISNSCKSLDDCVDLYLQEESLTGVDQYYCEKCKTHVDGTKKQDLWMLPPVLIVHLKRFKYNDYGKVGSKNEAAIKYPIIGWDLKSHVKSSRGVYPRYDLYGVINHMGGLGGGHYIAHALNRFDDTWYEFNDSSYRSVSESVHNRLSKSTYVLFYNRSEGDVSMPLNERSPLIRRQSVSRPDLWPHSQVDDPRMIRNFTRASRRVSEPTEPPVFLSSTIKKTDDDGTRTISIGFGTMSSIREDPYQKPSAEEKVQTLPHEPSEPLPAPPLLLETPSIGSERTNASSLKSAGAKSNEPMDRVKQFGRPKPRRRLRSTKPREV
ncbi:ubiquitin carboxyl-terminal hydrolase [Nitzschia inconspicua]|uniref:Ubiquitin carboxyl-terminal hydrolase n=1 Tax=Nitzschia inconspicua TaxID=303405 RepID=A0A9K3L1C9_9STRA|nr:ubiquitin carboxyl-terminal hydrolase [Nitzschia inconspicua]